MAAKKPWKYFPHVSAAKISFRKPSRHEEMNPNDRFRPHFDTWKEAHDWMLARAAKRVEAAQKGLKAAQREAKQAPAAYAAVTEMKDPACPCANPAQCWEPCGRLGKDERFVKVAE